MSAISLNTLLDLIIFSFVMVVFHLWHQQHDITKRRMHAIHFHWEINYIWIMIKSTAQKCNIISKNKACDSFFYLSEKSSTTAVSHKFRQSHDSWVYCLWFTSTEKNEAESDSHYIGEHFDRFRAEASKFFFHILLIY